MNVRWFNTVALTDAKYRILFVDEARGYSGVEYICNGEFRHNNAKFDEIKAIIFIKWDMGKIAKFNIVEMNANKISSIFLTKANRQWSNIMGALFNCDNSASTTGTGTSTGGAVTSNTTTPTGDCAQRVKDYIADDITITFNNLYPLSLLAGRKSGGDANAKEYEGKDVCVSLKGKDNALKFTNLAEKLYFDLTVDMRVLYSDENTVVAAKILRPVSGRLILPMDKKSFWKSVTVMYTINRFNENGLLRDVSILLNRPLNALNIRHIGQFVDRLYGQSLESLMEPLRDAVKLDACRV